MGDIAFSKSGYRFHCRVAGILVRDGKVLLQAPKNTAEYAFIGGHVALGETSSETLVREWREEMGAEILVGPLKWVEESLFSLGRQDGPCPVSYLLGRA